MPRSNEAFLLSGWLFADLLLALAVLFLAANTASIKAKPLLPPTLLVDSAVLDINHPNPHCTLEASIAQCSITISEPASSEGNIAWSVSSDISDTIKYTINGQPTDKGQLSPGSSKALLISAIPCQNGSFTFKGERVTNLISDKASAPTVVVLLRCTPRQERLDLNYRTFLLNVNNVDALLNGNSQDDNIKQQIKSQAILNGKSVGLTVVYAGAPDDPSIGQAQNVTQKIYNIMKNLGGEGFHAFDRSSFYRSNAADSLSRRPLYNLGNQPGQVQVDVYFFTYT